MIADLSTALEVEAARAGSTSGEATTVLEAVQPAERKIAGGRGRWSWVAVLLFVLVIGGTLLAVKLISDKNGPGGGGALNGKGNTIALSSASDYDPQGDGEEDPEEVGFAIDGNPTTTAWSSEHYDTDTFAGTKTGPDPGVGLYVTAKSIAQPSEMIIRTPSPGWDAEIFATASGPPEELGEWGEPVGTVTGAKSLNEVELHLEEPAKYFLIWFNKAAPAQDQEGRYQVEVSDVKLID
jgi:serine/threonine-protein kinase